jgi:hypothetical protein
VPQSIWSALGAQTIDLGSPDQPSPGRRGPTICLMTHSDDHGALPSHAERMLMRLERVEDLTIHGRTAHMQHMDHAKRVRQLAHHLRAVLLLSDARHYPSALVVVRAALEHHLMDRLIFLANRYVVTYTKVKKVDVPGWNAKLAAAQAGDQPDIATWFWDSGMNVVYRGLHSNKSKKGRGQTISSYYFQVDNFDPFAGPKKHAGRLAAPFWERRHRQQWADESASAWRHLFRHDAVMKALRVNRLLLGRHVQVDVHYGFLSGFAHPSKRGYEAIFGGNSPDRMGAFDHYASELLLLYVIVIAAAEIEIYGRMARRNPPLVLRDWDDVQMEVREAQLAASYFWFLSGEPTTFDRIDTVHTPPGHWKPKWGRPRVDPTAIRPVRVRYYINPLERLAKLHQSYREMSTGLVYRSPFERPDAFRR